ncbi:SLC13 family permease [Corynebacterium doosanense]|uniref:Citrate transporter-like domain-containing protein n=1 Tax=Corynebacterium doosanense CAU 212 = DSM 45436 TaxID=558173 RepID=A0A097IHF1_9CORY|nr:SLC13 family permease [Corynebacterium doosanense]AIT61560.1 hypothetical protein CDOO_09975 [Corynebacterium doosanense CAU 212 = DSM 45436]
MKPAVTSLVFPVVAVLALGALAATDLHALADYGARVVPVLAFVAFMAVVVNAADGLGTFDILLGSLRAGLGIRGNGRREAVATWVLIFGASVVSTVFFSLDTTAILLTPIALKLAASAGLHPLRAALTVVWTANLGSLLLPISNLTNLLAVQTPAFSGTADFVSASWRAALVLLAVAAIVPWLTPVGPQGERRAAERPRWTRPAVMFSLLLAVLLGALLSPLPVWVSAGAAAAVALGLTARWNRSGLRLSLVPWGSLILTLALTAVAALVHRLGLLDAVTGAVASLIDAPLAVAACGAVLANVVNNIPAYLALEPALGSREGLMALLIGVNAGSVITPWATLATLLWAEQAGRQGLRIGWGRFVLCGLVLAPVSVVAATAVL